MNAWSVAVGLIGGSVFGSAMAGTIGAILGGAIGALLGSADR